MGMDRYLKSQIRHLPLQEVRERLADYRGQLRQELRDHGIRFDFHIWVSDEWFCPDGVPGFALPFYLFHPELRKIHKRQTGQCEGRSRREILKLMRHELGHAIDNAFALRADKRRQQVFGSSKSEYPESYRPRRYSKNYIHYLGDNYAQSHPDEDFAETFAYWLDPQKSWRMKILSPKVQEKLHLMDHLMDGARRGKATLKNCNRVAPFEKDKRTLQQYYAELKEQREHRKLQRVDHNLRSTFITPKVSHQTVSLAVDLRKNKKKYCRWLSDREGVYQYEAELAVNKIIERAQRLDIQAPLSEIRLKSSTLIERNFRYLKEKDQLKIYL